MDPTFELAKVDDWFVLRVWGELDMATAPLLRQQVVSAVAHNVALLVLDLTGVEFMDSTALGVLVGAVKRVRQNDGELRVVCTRPHLIELFEITRLINVFELFETVEEAVGPLVEES